MFSLNAEQQSIIIVDSGSEVTRALVVNVTRHAGLFGNASVGYRISGGVDEMMDIEEIMGGQAEGRLFMREGQTFSTITVPISNLVTKKSCNSSIDTRLAKSKVIVICENDSFLFTLFVTLLLIGVLASWRELHSRAHRC